MSNILPVITLYQPWATWIMRGWKEIETRTHNRFVSLKDKRFLIHAGQRTDETAINNPYLSKEQIIYKPDEVVNSAIIGSAFCHDFRLLTGEDSAKALIDCASTLRFGNFLRDIQAFKDPIPCSGELGIWYYDIDKKQKVKKSDLRHSNDLKLF